MSLPIMLVEDDQDSRELLVELLRGQDYEVIEADGYERAEELLSQRTFGVVLSDLMLSSHSGLDVCRAATRVQPGVPVIMVTGHGSLSSAVDAIRAGAYDFIQKPVDTQLLFLAVGRALKHRKVEVELKELQDRLADKPPARILGQSREMKHVYDLIMRVGQTPSSVLITGESGTGKELVARALHDSSERKNGRFVAINCASVSGSLLESELFGHKRGAFTDARRDRAGLFEQANGGTLFLDEVGEMSAEMQAKLLRSLQERSVRPVGSEGEVSVDVRIVAATHRDLEEEIREGRFREDLFYRLNVVPIHLPPLRERGNDILLLAREFIRQKSAELGREVEGLTEEAARLLLAYDWPGNVRQLLNCVERAVALARYSRITPDDLPDRVQQSPGRVQQSLASLEEVSPLSIVERNYIEAVLRLTENNKSQAARLLGVDRRTLYRKLESYHESDRREADRREADRRDREVMHPTSVAI